MIFIELFYYIAEQFLLRPYFDSSSGKSTESIYNKYIFYAMHVAIYNVLNVYI